MRNKRWCAPHFVCPAKIWPVYEIMKFDYTIGFRSFWVRRLCLGKGVLEGDAPFEKIKHSAGVQSNRAVAGIDARARAMFRNFPDVKEG